jgi:5-methylcytosine-specific restriction endonuclease McrA
MPNVHESPADPNPEVKTCTKCGETKPHADYSRLKATGKLVAWCKACKSAATRAWVRGNPDRAKERARIWAAENPEQSKAIKRRYYHRHADKVAEYRRNRYEEGGGREYFAAYRAARREAMLEYKAAYNKEHAEERREKAVAHYAANREAIRARAKELFAADPHKYLVMRAKSHHRRRQRLAATPCTLTADEWAEILRLQDNRCAACRKKFNRRRPPCKDHIVPVSQGGGMTLENIQACCRSCNSIKYTKTIDYRGLLPGFLA